MNVRTARWLAWSLWAFSIGLAVVILLVENVLAPSVGVSMLAERVAHVVAFTALATVGAVVASRRPEYLMGWLVLLFPVLAATGDVTFDYARYAIHVRPGALPGGAIAGLLANAIWLLAWGLLPFVVLLFPRGTLLSPRWRWVAWGTGAVFGAFMVVVFLSPEVDLEVPPPVPNPLGIAGAEPVLDAVETIAVVAFFIVWVAAGVSLVLRFARTRGEERQQMKWFAYTAAIFTVFMVVIGVADETGYLPPGPWDDILFAAFSLLLPLGMAMAILKYRLYDIDVVINRTLVYGGLTGTLAVVYFGSVVLLQRLLPAESQLAIVISTLAIAALFAPLRRRIQNDIDRRFYRRKYDAQQVLAAFAETARDETDLDRLTDELVRVVEETMQPAQVSLWLKKTDASK